MLGWGPEVRNALGGTSASQPAEHTHTCSQAQWIVYIFEPETKVQRHKQETGSPSRAPFSGAFPYYKALPPPASDEVAGFSTSFSKRRAAGWDIQPDPVTQPKATSVPAQGSASLRQAGGIALDIGSQSLAGPSDSHSYFSNQGRANLRLCSYIHTTHQCLQLT